MRLPAIAVSRWAINPNGDVYRLDGYVGIGTDNPGGLLGLGDEFTYITVNSDGGIVFNDTISGSQTLSTFVQNSSNVAELTEAIQTILKDLDGYTNVNTDLEHYIQHSEAIQTILKDLDGYALDLTVSEHYSQHSEAINAITVALDGYTTIPISGSSADGYIAFFTGSNGLAGDNDLYWDRVNNKLIVSGSSEFQGPILFTGAATFQQNTAFNNDISIGANLFITLGSNAALYTNGSNSEFNISTGTTYNRNFIFTDFANRLIDHGVQLAADPTLKIFSNTNPTSDNTQWLAISHNQTDGYMQTGVGSIRLSPTSNLVKVDGYILPTADDAYGLGNEEYRWRDLWIEALHVKQNFAENDTGVERDWNFVIDNAGNLRLRQDGDTVMRISSDSSVSIGPILSTSGHKLSVDGKIGGTLYSGSYIEFPSAAGFTNIAANNDVNISTAIAPFALRIIQSGKVGINTISPQAQLHVAGDGYFDGYLMPFTDDTWGLGTPDKRWRDLYLGPGSIHIRANSSQTETGVERDWSIGADFNGELSFQQGADTRIKFKNTGELQFDGLTNINAPSDGALQIATSNGTSAGVRLRAISTTALSFDYLDGTSFAANLLAGSYTIGNNSGIFNSSGITLVVTHLLRWTDTGNSSSGTPDTGLDRAAAGILKVNNGSTGFGALRVTTSGAGLQFGDATSGFAGTATSIGLVLSSNSRVQLTNTAGAFYWDTGTTHTTFGSSVAVRDAGLVRQEAGLIRVSNGSTGYGNLALGRVIFQDDIDLGQTLDGYVISSGAVASVVPSLDNTFNLGQLSPARFWNTVYGNIFQGAGHTVFNRPDGFNYEFQKNGVGQWRITSGGNLFSIQNTQQVTWGPNVSAEDTGIARAEANFVKITNAGAGYGNLALSNLYFKGGSHIEADDTSIYLAPVDGYVLPTVDDGYSLGSPTNRWKDLWLGPGTLHFVQNISENDTSVNKDWAMNIDSAGNLNIGQGDARKIKFRDTGELQFDNISILSAPGDGELLLARNDGLAGANTFNMWFGHANQSNSYRIQVTTNSNSFYFKRGNATSSWAHIEHDNSYFRANGETFARIVISPTAKAFNIGSDIPIYWMNNIGDSGGSPWTASDVGLHRHAANVLKLNNGLTGYGSLQLTQGDFYNSSAVRKVVTSASGGDSFASDQIIKWFDNANIDAGVPDISLHRVATNALGLGNGTTVGVVLKSNGSSGLLIRNTTDTDYGSLQVRGFDAFTSSVRKVEVNNSTHGIDMASDMDIVWRNNTDVTVGAFDVGLARVSSNILRVSDAADGYGSLAVTDGNALSPGIRFASENTGLHLRATGRIAFDLAGTDRFNVWLADGSNLALQSETSQLMFRIGGGFIGAWTGNTSTQLAFYAGGGVGTIQTKIGSGNVDGNFLITDSAGINCGSILLGGNTSEYPAIKRSANNIQIYLADNSTTASLQANNIYVDGYLSIGGATQIIDLGNKLSIVGSAGVSAGNAYFVAQDATATHTTYQGVTSSTGFTGTFSNSPFEIRTNNTNRLRIDANGTGNLTANQVWQMSTAVLCFTNSSTGHFWQGQTSNAQFSMGLGTELGRQIVVCDTGSYTQDFLHPLQTHPTFFFHSATAPSVNPEEWLSISHIGSDGYIATGKGNIILEPADGYVATHGQIVSILSTSHHRLENAITIDWNQGNNQIIDLGLNTGLVTLSYINAQPGAWYTLKIIQHATIPQTITWPSGTKWSGGTPPVISIGAYAEDLVKIWYDGESYYSNVIQNYL